MSQLLSDLPEDRVLRLGELLATFGARAHGTALLILSLPDAMPLPIPSVGAILGIPLALVSLHLAVFGEAGRLPPRVQEVPLPAATIAVLRRRVAPLLRRAESLSQPRLEVFAARQRPLGLICLLLSLVLLLPIPLMNTPPSLCLALLAWGMIQRDGAFVVAGLVASAALFASLALIADRLAGVIA